MHAAARRQGVDVLMDEWLSLDHIPACPHGPMLLFERYSASAEPHKYFACSASRDRKACDFFVHAHQSAKHSQKETLLLDSARQAQQQKRIAGEAARLRLQAVPVESTAAFQYCRSCQLCLLSAAETKLHKGHSLRSCSSSELARPTYLLDPLDANKSNAQYFIGATSMDVIVSVLRQSGLRNVVCLGMPRLHELLQSPMAERHPTTPNGPNTFRSFLLDLDDRFHQFYGSDQFAHFNMMNGHFFDEDAKAGATSFLQNADVIVCDPPFGVLLQPLAHTIKTFSELTSKQMRVIFIFPYYLEDKVTEALPVLRMTDFAIDYDNHSTFKKGGNTKGSPVRAYTNIPSRLFKLPKPDYRFCTPCDRFVSVRNRHCSDCNACTSKDGSEYLHCHECGFCVKAGREHCQTCQRCLTNPHECITASESVCHLCGMSGHKRRNCPTSQANEAPTTTQRQPTDTLKSSDPSEPTESEPHGGGKRRKRK
eukprot:m.132138 g.132138  ORF g.132138 m.132138 type:complete len:481 (-) comp52374_c0_seq10:19-1461(-)